MGDRMLAQYEVSGIETAYVVKREESGSSTKYFIRIGGKERKDRVYGMNKSLSLTMLSAEEELIEEADNEMLKLGSGQDKLFKIIDMYSSAGLFNTEEDKTSEGKQ